MSKIKSEKPKLETYFSKLNSEIISSVDKVPPYLNLEDQGMFMLGYYHQRHFRKSEETDQNSKEEKP